MSHALALATLWLLPAQAPVERAELLEIAHLRGQVAWLQGQLARRDEALDGLRRELRTLAESAAQAPAGSATSVAGPFLAAPPPSSDAVGVAPVAVLNPRVEIDSKQRHDAVSFRIRRLETAGSRPTAEVDLGSDQDGVDLPLDQNGALYVVDWATSEGYTATLRLKDGATGGTAATAQVRPLQREGRFVFVGFRLE